MEIRYGVIGTGAIGAYYGGKLAVNGKEVHFLFNTEYEAVKQNGLKVKSVNGNFAIGKDELHAYKDVKEMPECDVVIVALKTTREHLLGELLPEVTKKHAAVILIQNGLGMEHRVREMLKSSRPDVVVCGGMAYICASREAPGVVGHYDQGRVTVGAERDDYQEEAYAEGIHLAKQACQDMENAGIQAKWTEDLQRTRWEKLVWNIPYNGMCVALNTSTDKIQENAAARAIIKDLMEEVVKGGQACGVKIEMSYAEQMLAFTDKMTPYAPSMKLDYDNHRPLELETIYQAPIEEARKHGYKMKRTEMLMRELEFLSQVIISQKGKKKD